MTPMRLEFTQHATRALAEREIASQWVERMVEAPEMSLVDPHDPAVERRLRRIPEFGDRVLRVAVNTTVEPLRIVSVFFDRRMKGKL